MLNRTIRAAVVALAVAVLPAALSAQQRPPSAQRAAAPRAGAAALTPAQREAQGWYRELMQIGQRLQAAQLRAMQDPQLKTAQEQLGRDFKAAMVRADPTLANVDARARAMEAEAKQAQQAGDRARMERLTREAQQIQVKVMNAQQRVLRDNPALATRAKSFEEQLRRKMVQVEPQTMALVSRGQELQGKLAQAGRAQQGAPKQ